MKRSVTILIHLGYWAAYLILWGLASMAIGEFPSFSAEEVTFYRGVIVGVAIVPAFYSFYIFYFFLFPAFLQKRLIFKALVSGLLVSLTAFLLGAITLRYTANMGWSCYGESDYLGVMVITFIAFMNGLVAFIIRGFITWYEEIKVKEDLQQKNHEMELALVKSQLDPHFLFNTLNNIDTLILKDADLASAYLNKLSHIMRFMLFETKTEDIALETELEYIHKYVELQRIRTANEHYVTFTVEGDPRGKTIAPLVFIPFIENAFKHTNNKKIKDAIEVRIYVNGQSVHMKCENKMDPTRKSEAMKNGLGQELITKRLQLLYPRQHSLQVDHSPESYRVSLNIDYEPA